MACVLTQGFSSDCLDGLGGSKEILLCNWSDFQSGITIDPTTEEIDTLPAATIFKYVPLKNSLVWTETPTPSAENGTLFYAESIVFRMGALSAAKRLEFKKLAAAKLIAFVRLYTAVGTVDKIVCVGRESGLYLSAGNWGSGAARGDFSGYEFTLTAEEPIPANYLEAYTDVPFDNFPDITVSPGYAS
jgi:hypothetical protein